jgi:hypothetical protein
MTIPPAGRRLQASTPIALALLFTACTVPNFQGPQVQEPPPAFTMNASTHQERRMFPDRDVVHHDAWVEASWGNFSGIYINGHPGVIARADVVAAREEAIQAATGRRAEFGEIEEILLDGRAAWGWGENWREDNGGLEFVVFRAAVPYDTISYAIDFLTGDPSLKSRPDSLRTVVASFAVGRTTWNFPLLAIGAGATLLLLSLLRKRALARAQATRRMTLIKMPAKEEEEGPTDTSTVAGAIAQKLRGQQDAPTPPPDPVEPPPSE